MAEKNTKIYSAKTSLRGSTSYISNNLSTFNTLKKNILSKNNSNNSALTSNLLINPNSILVSNNFSSQPNSVRNSVVKNNPYRLSNFPSYSNNKNESLININNNNHFNSNNESNSNFLNFAGSFASNLNSGFNNNFCVGNLKGNGLIRRENPNANSFSMLNEDKKYSGNFFKGKKQ